MKIIPRFLLVLMIAAVLVSDLAGCSPNMKKKFIRKRAKKESALQPIFSLQPDAEAVGPPDVRYRERFAYWKSWHSDLIASLGESKKRDIRYLDGAIGELGSMSGLLAEGPEAEQLRKNLAELNDIKKAWSTRAGSWAPTVAERLQLDRIAREVNKKLHYSKVKNAIHDPKQGVPAGQSPAEPRPAEGAPVIEGTPSPKESGHTVAEPQPPRAPAEETENPAS